MTQLERVERAKGGPFTYLLGGEVRGLPSPVDMTPDQILHALQTGFRGLPVPRMRGWQATLLFERWIEHYDLPSVQDIQRLAYLIERYSNVLEFDLVVYAAGADLGALWRGRRWRFLLNLIDHLPGHSHYAAAVSQDEEHAELLAAAMANRGPASDERPSPALTSWTPEVNVLADLVDAVNALRHVTIVMGGDGKSQPKPPEPYTRPKSAIQEAMRRAEYDRRKAAHESLTLRLLPHKRKAKAQWPVEPPEPEPPTPGTAYLRRMARKTD